MVVVLPENEQQVCDILETCHAMRVPVVARGAGTGLSGGALPLGNGVLLSLAKLMKILDIDPAARTARVQPGVRNLAISEAAAPLRALLRARSVEPDRLLDRRQRRRELRRRALPEVRPDRAQHSQAARRHHRGRDRRARRRRARCRGLRPAGAADRFRRPARRGHRNHREAAAATGVARRSCSPPSTTWPRRARRSPT